MDIPRKVEIVNDSLRSIAEHRDEDGAVRIAVLEQIKGNCDRQIAAVEKEQAQKIKAALA
jgi:hypothetical protein